MKKVITYGTFDLTHIGHINLLARAKEICDYLIVGLSTDEFNVAKNKSAIFSYSHRKQILEAIKYVDLVIPECNWEQKSKDIEELEVDILVMGDDWSGHFDYLNTLCDVIYLPRTENISTSLIRQNVKERS